MAKVENSDILRLIIVFGGSFAIIIALAVAGILFRSPDVELDQDVFPLGLTVSPNPLPGVGLNQQGSANFTLLLTVFNSAANPNLTLTLHVVPTQVENLTVQHCLENSQPELTGLNSECDLNEWEVYGGEYFANVTSGGNVVFEVQALIVGPITEPVSLHWQFWAEGEEII